MIWNDMEQQQQQQQQQQQHEHEHEHGRPTVQQTSWRAISQQNGFGNLSQQIHGEINDKNIGSCLSHRVIFSK